MATSTSRKNRKSPSDPDESLPHTTLTQTQHHLDPSVRASAFRLETQNRDGRLYYSLTSGSRTERQSMSIGFCTAENARKYLAGMEGNRALWLAWQEMVLRDLGANLLESPDVEPKLTMPEWRYDEHQNTLVWDAVSPGRLMETARKPARRDAVLRYLLELGEKALVLTTNPIKFQQRVASEAEPIDPMVAAMMPLREYHDRVWAAQRQAAYPKTWKNEEGLWRLHLLPALGDKKLGELSTPLFHRFIQSVRQLDGSEFSYHALHRLRVAYQALINDADFQGIPVQPHRYRALRGKERGTVSEYQVLTPEELERICAKSDAMHAAMFTYAFYTGSRPSEITRLTWSAFDWAPSEKAPYGRVWIDGKKTNKSNDVLPVPEVLRTRILALRGAAEAGGAVEAKGSRARPPSSARAKGETAGAEALGGAEAEDSEGKGAGEVLEFTPVRLEGPVFTHRGVALVDPKKALSAAALRAKFPKTRRIFPYLFRHSYATWLLENGATISQVALLLRHTSEQMVRRIYDHAKVVDKVDIRELLAAKVAK